MPADRFRPFQTALDHDVALSLLRDAVTGADDGELFLERRRSEVLVLDDGRVKNASYDASEGFGLRAVRGDGQLRYTQSACVTQRLGTQTVRRDHQSAAVAMAQKYGQSQSQIRAGPCNLLKRGWKK